MKMLIGIFLIGFLSAADGRCSGGCDVALGSYYMGLGYNLSFISQVMGVSVNAILSYNPQISNQDAVLGNIRVNVPFSCDCPDGEYLRHVFSVTSRAGLTYGEIVGTYYSNLTTVSMLEASNSYPPFNIPNDVTLNVPVNCSCGDRDVSPDYGLFITYPMRDGESLETVAAANFFSMDMLRKYNPMARNSPTDLIFIPGKDQSGAYPPLNSSKGLSTGAIAGTSVAAIVGVLLFAGSLYVGTKRKKNARKVQILLNPLNGASAIVKEVSVDKSVEFSYDELASATNGFSITKKIGEGGFGAVYYAELRGEKMAIKKMDMQASREFLTELKVLTRVHHLNLVRLIGYCVEGSLFLVYEFIENGNLSQHLRSSGREPLPWSTRVQIALGSARGLEYIHEHTVSVYIHRDINPANILIDKNFHAKVAGFGLTKLTEVGSNTLPTGRLVGTFGYMSPEYVQYGHVSPKLDVYAFGVVLYELISAKEAIVKGDISAADPRGLVALFDEVLSNPDASEDLTKLVDPRLGDNYPMDLVQKMAQLAQACTHETPHQRPTMQSIVVALMTLSSATKDWDVGTFYSDTDLRNLVTER